MEILLKEDVYYNLKKMVMPLFIALRRTGYILGATDMGINLRFVEYRSPNDFVYKVCNYWFVYNNKNKLVEIEKETTKRSDIISTGVITNALDQLLGDLGRLNIARLEVINGDKNYGTYEKIPNANEFIVRINI